MESSQKKRSFQIGAIGLASALALAACGESSAASGEVVFVNTGGVIEEVLNENAYIALEEQGINAMNESPNDRARLQAMVEADNTIWDVSLAGPSDTIQQCDVLWEPLDFDRIDTTGLDEDQITECGVPFMNSSFVLVYNQDTYGDNPPSGWEDFYDPSFPGTRGIMNYAKDMGIETALLASGVEADELYPLDFDRAFETLDGIRDQTNFYDTGAEQTEALQNGTVDMMLAWPTRAYDAARNGANVAVAWNQPINYWDNIGIVKGAPNQDEAYELINALISEDNQTALAQELPIRPVNDQAEVSEDEHLNQFLNIDNRAEGTTINRDDEWWGEYRDEANQQWIDWVNR